MSLQTRIEELVTALGVDNKALRTQIGTLSSLTTSVKTSLVGSVNELKSNVGSLPSLQTSNKSSLVVAINELKTLISGLGSGPSISGFANVRDYGADGVDDGVDDSDAFIAAIKVLIGTDYTGGQNTRAKGYLYIPSGFYTILKENAWWGHADMKKAGNNGQIKMRGFNIIGGGIGNTYIKFNPGLSALPANPWEGNLMSALAFDPSKMPLPQYATASLPTTGNTVGRLVYDTTTKSLKAWNGTSWEDGELNYSGGSTLEETRVSGFTIESLNQYASFFYGYCSDTGPQSFFHTDHVEFRGAWVRGYGFDGPAGGPYTNQNSEFHWDYITTVDTTEFSDAFIRGGMTNDAQQEQQVNYSLNHCSMEYKKGACVKLSRGGSLQVNGGSYIIGINDTTPTAMFVLGQSTSGFGAVSNRHAIFEGVRFEMRHKDALILDCWWATPQAHVVFDSCGQGDASGSGSAGWRPYQMRVGQYGMATLSLRNSTIFGGINLVHDATPSGDYSGTISIDACTAWNFMSGGMGPAGGTVISGTASATNGAAAITLTNHGLAVGDIVTFSALSGITGGINTTGYWMVKSVADANTFTVRPDNGSPWTPPTAVVGTGTATVTKRYFIESSNSFRPKLGVRDCTYMAPTSWLYSAPMTQAAYDALTKKDPYTLYVVI